MKRGKFASLFTNTIFVIDVHCLTYKGYFDLYQRIFSLSLAAVSVCRSCLCWTWKRTLNSSDVNCAGMRGRACAMCVHAARATHTQYYCFLYILYIQTPHIKSIWNRDHRIFLAFQCGIWRCTQFLFANITQHFSMDSTLSCCSTGKTNFFCWSNSSEHAQTSFLFADVHIFCRILHINWVEISLILEHLVLTPSSN